MLIDLTPRMKNWISAYGLHIATATKDGFPTVIVVDSVIADGSTIKALLSTGQVKQIQNNILENPQVALAPAQLGSVRAPYQFKGKAKITCERLEILVDEVYCTKPGAEAGIRLDTMSYEGMRNFEEKRWTDFAPSNEK